MYPERGRGESKGTLTYVPGEGARGESRYTHVCTRRGSEGRVKVHSCMYPGRERGERKDTLMYVPGEGARGE